MTDAMIEFRDVSKRYGNLLANDHLSLTIRRGELGSSKGIELHLDQIAIHALRIDLFIRQFV